MLFFTWFGPQFGPQFKKGWEALLCKVHSAHIDKICCAGKALPGVNFINILRALFLYEQFVQSQTLRRKKLLKRFSYQKRAHKTLMKLTAGSFSSWWNALSFSWYTYMRVAFSCECINCMVRARFTVYTQIVTLEDESCHYY